MKKILKATGTVLTVFLFFLAILAFRAGFWMLETWAHLTVDELIFHLKAPMEGTNEELIMSFITTCLLAAFILMALLICVLILFRKKKVLYRTVHGIVLVVSPLIIGFTAYHVWSSLNLGNYVASQTTYSSFIDSNYANPSEVQITFPEEKRNLIHIYLESVETTYTNKENGGAFDDNVIPELTTLAQTYEDFSGTEKILNGGVSLTGTTWTMGALFAQTSGLPLSIPIDGNAMSGQATFMPNLITMGDILEDAGYQQAFLIGSQATFGGRALYFTEHGNYTLWDYDYFVKEGKIPSDYYVWWGFEDYYLMDFAKEKLTWLASQNEPFNLTMLTVDTHFENGYVCKDCQTYIENNQYANVMYCSSSKIYELVSWIQQQDFYENTTIVLTGDHPTMDSDFCSGAAEDYQRKVYTAYINAPVTPEDNTYRSYSTFDIFPTTLASLGVEIEGNRLALGTNLFSNTPTLCEEVGIDHMDLEIQKKSELMEELTSDITYAKATISTTPYKPTEGTFTILIEDLDYSVTIEELRCLVWTIEDQSDAKWYTMPYVEGEEYSFTIPVADFPMGESTYYINAYAYAENTLMYSLGSAIVEDANSATS